MCPMSGTRLCEQPMKPPLLALLTLPFLWVFTPSALAKATLSPRTAELYNRLKQTVDANKTLLGQQRFTSGIIAPDSSPNAPRYQPWRRQQVNGIHSDIKTLCGKNPAIFGTDMNDYDLRRTNAKFLQDLDRAGIILTINWHMHNLVTGGNYRCPSKIPCDRRQIARILPGGDKHSDLLQKLDRAAAFFKTLKDDRGELIPVIFRPWHEMNGGWFWWGAPTAKNGLENTPEEYKALFNFTINYLRQKRGVTNILVAYAPNIFGKGAAVKKSYLQYYPGDETVDILGLDAYVPNLPERLATDVAFLPALARSKQKVAALTEVGFHPQRGFKSPDSQNRQNTWWSSLLTPLQSGEYAYLLTWSNRPNAYFVPYLPPALQDFQRFCRSNLIKLAPN